MEEKGLPTPRLPILRPLLIRELAPCRFCRTNQGELFLATMPMRPEWVTCRPCAQEGKKAVGLNTEFGSMPVHE